MPPTPVQHHPLWRNLVLLLILAATLFVAGYLTATRPRNVGGTAISLESIGQPAIIHNGERYRLSKPYSNGRAYEADPNRIAPSDRQRAAQAVLRQPVPIFATQTGLIEAFAKVRFIGFDARHPPAATLPDGSELLLFLFEVPYADANRVLLYYGRQGAYALLDDRVLPASIEVEGVTATSSTVAYVDKSGAPLLTLPWRQASPRPHHPSGD